MQFKDMQSVALDHEGTAGTGSKICSNNGMHIFIAVTKIVMDCLPVSWSLPHQV